MGSKTDNKAEKTSAPGVKPAMFTVKKQVTRPVIQMKEGEAIHVVFQGAIYRGKEIKAKQGEPDSKPADLCHVVSLDTGLIGQIVVGEVLKGTLIEAYPNDGYVGKAFRITKSPVAGKRYKQYAVAELELSDEAKEIVRKAA